MAPFSKLIKPSRYRLLAGFRETAGLVAAGALQHEGFERG
jgi:hypothetical protein